MAAIPNTFGLHSKVHRPAGTTLLVGVAAWFLWSKSIEVEEEVIAEFAKTLESCGYAQVLAYSFALSALSKAPAAIRVPRLRC